MKDIFRYIRPFLGYISVTLAIKFVASIMELLIPSILATIIDDIVPTGDRGKILLWGGVMALCALTALLGNIFANRMAAKSAGSITENIRHDLFSKITYLSARQLDGFTIPSAVSRLTTDTYNLNQLFARMQRIGVRDGYRTYACTCHDTSGNSAARLSCDQKKRAALHKATERA